MIPLDRALAWARAHMPRTQAQLALLPALDGVRLACSIHLTGHVLDSLAALLAQGAQLFLTTCNPATVQTDVVDALAERGADGRPWRGMDSAAQATAVAEALAWQPTHLFEMGADLSSACVAAGGPGSVRAGLEVTGSGITRLEALAAQGQALPFPIYNCDDVPIKEGLHNRHLVGLMTWHTFTARTRLSLHGRRVVVVGYGLVGEGVAAAARAWGGVVAVAERDPARALQARFAGYDVSPLEALLPTASVVVTATGASHVLSARHFALLPEGCFLINVGHTSDEIDVAALGPREEVLPFVEAARPAGRTFYLLAGGAMANLAAGEGDSLNSFDITLATMLAGLRYTFTPEAQARPPGIWPLPREVWEEVAKEAGA
jgi:adenosylhomocysteinase